MRKKSEQVIYLSRDFLRGELVRLSENFDFMNKVKMNPIYNSIFVSSGDFSPPMNREFEMTAFANFRHSDFQLIDF